MKYIKLIKEFVEYCNDFYNIDGGIYPIATNERINEAVTQFIESKPLSEIYFDSFDRECVRKIIQPEHMIV